MFIILLVRGGDVCTNVKLYQSYYKVTHCENKGISRQMFVILHVGRLHMLKEDSFKVIHVVSQYISVQME